MALIFVPFGTDNDFNRPSGTEAASLHRYPGTSCLATIVLSLRDENHSTIEALALGWPALNACNLIRKAGYPSQILIINTLIFYGFYRFF
jgi:hypothetical protein